MDTGIDLIAKEREEQISKHGRSVEDDVKINSDGQLCSAAFSLLTESTLSLEEDIAFLAPDGWDKKAWFKMYTKPYRERLIIAGALVAAELDRISHNKLGRRVSVVVADKKEISAPLSQFLEALNIPVFVVGFGCSNTDAILEAFEDVDEVWNIGSVGGILPLYSVFEVGVVVNEKEDRRIVLSGQAPVFTVRTVSEFQTSKEGFGSVVAVDMELFHLAAFARDRRVNLRSFKFVSDNLSEDFTSETWHKEIDTISFIASEPLIQLLKKQYYVK